MASILNNRCNTLASSCSGCTWPAEMRHETTQVITTSCHMSHSGALHGVPLLKTDAAGGFDFEKSPPVWSTFLKSDHRNTNFHGQGRYPRYYVTITNCTASSSTANTTDLEKPNLDFSKFILLKQFRFQSDNRVAYTKQAKSGSSIHHLPARQWPWLRGPAPTCWLLRPCTSSLSKEKEMGLEDILVYVRASTASLMCLIRFWSALWQLCWSSKALGAHEWTKESVHWEFVCTKLIFLLLPALGLNVQYLKFSILIYRHRHRHQPRSCADLEASN